MLQQWRRSRSGGRWTNNFAKKKKKTRSGAELAAETERSKGLQIFKRLLFLAVLKRLFEYSNIFEQGFQNEYSNTKIENRIFEKVMNRAPSTMCKPSAAPLGAAAKAASR